jgi:hypothetical protein
MGPAKGVSVQLLQRMQANDRIAIDPGDRPSHMLRPDWQTRQWIPHHPEHLFGSGEAAMSKQEPLPPHLFGDRQMHHHEFIGTGQCSEQFSPASASSPAPLAKARRTALTDGRPRRAGARRLPEGL